MRRQKGVAAKTEVYLNPHLCKVQHFGDCYKMAKKIATQPDYSFPRSFFSGSKRSSAMAAWAGLALIAPPCGDFVSHHRERRAVCRAALPTPQNAILSHRAAEPQPNAGQTRRQAESQAPPKSSQQATILRCTSTSQDLHRNGVGCRLGLPAAPWS